MEQELPEDDSQNNDDKLQKFIRELEGFLLKKQEILSPSKKPWFFIQSYKSHFYFTFITNVLLLSSLIFILLETGAPFYEYKGLFINKYEICVYAILVTFMNVIYFTLKYMKWKDLNFGFYYKIKSWIQNMKKTYYPELNLPYFKGLEMVRLLHGDRIIWTPIDLLVKGDIILLSDSESIENAQYELCNSIKPSLVESFKFQRFCKVKKTPFIEKLEHFIHNQQIGYLQETRNRTISNTDYLLSIYGMLPNKQASTNAVLLPPQKELSSLLPVLYKYFSSSQYPSFIFITLLLIIISTIKFFAFNVVALLLNIIYTSISALLICVLIYCNFVRLLIEILDAYADARLYQLWETLQTSQKPFLEAGQHKSSSDSLSSLEQRPIVPKKFSYDHPNHLTNVSEENLAYEQLYSQKQQFSMSETFSTFSSTRTLSTPKSNGRESIRDMFEEKAFKDIKKVSDSMEEAVEEDAFDEEAAPPTKEVTLSRPHLWKKWMQRLFPSLFNSLNSSSCPINLFPAMANVSIVLSNQEKGTLFMPFPIPEQLVFFHRKEKNVLDSSPFSFSCSEKANTIMNNSNSLDSDTDTSSSTSSSSQSSDSESEDEVVLLDLVPDEREEGGVRFEDIEWRKYQSSLSALSYSLIIRHPLISDNVHCAMASLERKARRGPHLVAHKLHSNSHRVLEMSKDCPFHYLFTSSHQTCFCHFGFAIGGYYLYKIFSRDIAPGSYGEVLGWCEDEILPTTTKQLKQWNYRKRWIQYNIIYDEKNDTLQIIGQGDFENILDSSTDYYDGNSVDTLTDVKRKRMNEAGLLEERNYFQVVAYSVRIIPLSQLLIDFGGDFSDSGKLGYFIINEIILKLIWLQWAENGKFTYFLQGQAQPIIEGSILFRVLNHLLKEHTFLGFVAFGADNKEDICECIQDFAQAGIRFVYYSYKDERSVKDIGDRLDLETDWNSCIILSSTSQLPHIPLTHFNADKAEIQRSVTPDYLKSDLIVGGNRKGHLPRGVRNIRRHLTQVDDIPLHVSLFAEAGTHDTLEMMKIYKEAGEVILYWGSGLSGRDLGLFLASHVSITNDPYSDSSSLLHRAAVLSNKKMSEKPFVNSWDKVKALHQCLLPTNLQLKLEMSPYIITQMIQEARTFKHNFNQCILFIISSQMTLFIVMIVWWLITDWPIPSTIYDILWMYWVALPFIGCHLLCTQEEADVLKWMPGKQNRLGVENPSYNSDEIGSSHACDENTTDIPRRKHSYFIKLRWRFRNSLFWLTGRKWWFIFLVSIIAYYLLLDAFVSFFNGKSLNLQLYNSHDAFFQGGDQITSSNGNGSDLTLFWAIRYSQITFTFIFMLLAGCQSISEMHHVYSIREFSLKKNVWLLLAVFITLLLHFGYCYLQLYSGPLSFSLYFRTLPYSIWILLLLALILIPIYQELVIKRWDKVIFLKSQKRAKLEFNTKLGMHSPI